MAFKTKVTELQSGDDLWVENEFGEFFKAKVSTLSHHQIYTGKYRFQRGTGWETANRYTPDLKTGLRTRYRVHDGHGNLFTTEQVVRLETRQRVETERTEIIHSLLVLPIWKWRDLSDQELLAISAKLLPGLVLPNLTQQRNEK